MRRKSNGITRELIISFGFINGFWFGLGINPQTMVLTFVGKYVNLLPPMGQKIFTIIPIILTLITVITVLKVYRRGGILGGIAVITAFAAGALLLKNWQATVILGLAAILLGLITFKEN